MRKCANSRGRLHPLEPRQLAGQGELYLSEQPPVRPLVRVGRFPIGVRVLLGPPRHVPRFGVLQLRSVAFVAALALDVVVLCRGRLPAPAAADRGAEVVERHKEILPQAGGRGAGEELTCRTGLLGEKPLSVPSINRCRGLWRALVASITRGISRRFPCYHRPMTEALQDGLDRLKQRREDLKAAIVAKKREAARLQKKQSQALEQQLRRVRSRLSSSERKLRTRRLIVLGGLMEKEAPPAALLSKLDRSLDRDQDRALFGLPPKAPAGDDRTAPVGAAPLEGWRPARLPDGSWGSLYTGSNAKSLPLELVGLTISVRARSGKSWDATITEVVERSRERVLVRTRRLKK